MKSGETAFEDMRQKAEDRPPLEDVTKQNSEYHEDLVVV
jgi:hypothetical protein